MSGAHAGAQDGRGVPVGLVVSTAFVSTESWRPEELRGTRAVLPLLERVIGARRERERILRIVARITPRVVTLAGPRPDADVVASGILTYVDALLDRNPAARAALVAGPGEAYDLDAETARLRAERFILLMHWHGRFGNRMHQYAYGVTYARLNGCRFLLPSAWEGTHLFVDGDHAVLPRGELRAELARWSKGPEDAAARLAAVRDRVPDVVHVRPANPEENYRRIETSACFDDLCAYHPSIFTAMSRTHLRAVLAFSERVKGLDLYKRLEDRQGTYDIAHLRRDDISNPAYNQAHPQGYSVVSLDSYRAAFAKYGYDPAAIEWVSDDYSRRWHADRVATRRGRWRYPAGSEVLPDVIFDWLEDFLRLYFARTIFRANSSFSWWAAFLSPHARVFSPVLDRRHIYGVDGMEEITVEFVEGNHPHWMYGAADIVLGD